MKMILISTLFLAAVNAEAAGNLSAKFQGYTEPADEATELSVTVDRVKTTAKEILILFDHRQAFYSFPARKKDRDEIESYLKKAARDHRELRVRMNPRTAHILLIETN